MQGIQGGAYQPLSQQDIKTIHESSLELLIEVGLNVLSEKAFEVFKKAGADVDTEKRMVKIPYGVVQSALKTAPKEVTLYGREDKHNLRCTGKNVHMGTGGTTIYALDLYTNKKRKALMKDIRNIARLVDALENIHFYVIPVYPTDIKPSEVDISRFYGSILNTSKHVMSGIFTWEGLDKTIRMAEEVAGGKEELRKKPFISFIACVMSPLKMDSFYGDLLVEIAKKGLPIAVPAEPLAGLTSPITIAGTLTGLHAETLAKLVIAQIINPGTPILYGCVASSTDPWTMRYVTGSIEMGLINAAAAQLAQYCELPNYTTAGMSDSKMVDAQNGYEKALTSLMVALSGSNFIHDSAGLVEFAMTASYKQYVIDNEINGMVMRAVKGIEVNKDTIALDLFKKVGPGGNFIGEKHTAKYLRREHFIPKISDRRTRSEWESDGRMDVEQSAIKEAKRILREHKPLSLSPGIRTRIRELFPEVWDTVGTSY
ncbi:trimethylamine methyltransferase family protein [Elusimicrobiota bacterium]